MHDNGSLRRRKIVPPSVRTIRGRGIVASKLALRVVLPLGWSVAIHSKWMLTPPPVAAIGTAIMVLAMQRPPGPLEAVTRRPLVVLADESSVVKSLVHDERVCSR